MFTPELQRSMRTSSQTTPVGGRCMTPLSSSTPRRKSVGHVTLSTSWGSSPQTSARTVLQDNRQRIGTFSGSFSLPRRASLGHHHEKNDLSVSRSNSVLSLVPRATSRSNLRLLSNEEDSVFINKEVTFQDSIQDSIQHPMRGSVQNINKYNKYDSTLYLFDETAAQQNTQSSLIQTSNQCLQSSNAVEFEQALFERTALRHARRLRLQEEVNELCQETALMQEKTAKLMANTARVRRLRIKLDMDLLDVDTLDTMCISAQLARDLRAPSDTFDGTVADGIYQEIDAVRFSHQSQMYRKYQDDEKENRPGSQCSSPSIKRQPSQVQTNRAAKLRSNSIRKQRDGQPGNLHEKPPVIPRYKKPEFKKSKTDLTSKDSSSFLAQPQNHGGRVPLKEKHVDQEQEKETAQEKSVTQGFQMKLKKVSKKLTSSRLSLDKKVDLSVESTWL